VIECIFTIDYEIYGNGRGSLDELVYQPTKRLIALFRKWNVPLVVFVEAAELEMIEAKGTDKAIDAVRKQISEMSREGFEIALHLHPQWYRAQYENGAWRLDYSEYNLCTLTRERIREIVRQGTEYLRYAVQHRAFSPISFRAGNWLFQPARTAASVLAEHGFRIDSSVFKGGRQRTHGLDYRAALRNGYFWKFNEDVNVPDPTGILLEIPTYSVMVPSWKMLAGKRIGLQRKAGISSTTIMNRREKVNRVLDRLRPRYPLKLDFCRMTLKELTSTFEHAVHDDLMDPESYRPLVAIGHSKDLLDFETVDGFLSYLKHRDIGAVTLQDALPKTNVVFG